MQYRIHREGDAQNTPFSASTPVDNWERNTLREVLLAAYQEQRRARIWRNIWRGVAVLIFLSLIFSLAEEEGKTTSIHARSEHTAVIDLTGEIGNDIDDQVQILRDSMEAAYENGNAKAIIIRANSPGGSPVVSNTAFNEVRRLKAEHKDIPVYLVAEDMCASGCYYIAAAADKIYADPSSIVGSIGVIGGGFDFTGLMDKAGVKRRLKTAGSNKGMGDPFSPETPEQQAIWQQMLNDIHGEFIKAVKSGRGSRLKDNDPEIFSGRVYTGLEAKKNGLIDDFGNIYSVARDVVQAPELVDYTPDEDDLARAISRRLNGEVQNQVREGLQNLAKPGW